MTKDELRRQKIMAGALLERLELECAIGLVDAAAVAAQRDIYSRLRDYVLPDEKTDLATQSGTDKQTKGLVVLTEEKPFVTTAAKVDENDPVLMRLRAELLAIDAEKTKAINLLATMPTDSRQVDLVNKIKDLREAWVSASDKIYYYIEHGEEVGVVRDEASDSSDLIARLMESLPKDKFVLNKRLLNLRANLSKYRKRQQEAKTDVQRAHQLKNIAQAELEINAIGQLLSSII